MNLKYVLLVLLFLGVNLTIKCQNLNETNVSATSKISEINSSNLHGRWHLVEIIMELDDSEGVGSKAEESFKKSTESQRKVKKQIQDGELAIITQFNFDNTYTHELVFSDPEIQFPSYKESGTWFFDENTNQLSRKSLDQEITTLELTVVKRLNQNELVLELKYNDKKYEGIYNGLVETLYLKRFRETKAKN